MSEKVTKMTIETVYQSSDIPTVARLRREHPDAKVYLVPERETAGRE